MVPVDLDLFRQISLQALVRTKNPIGIANQFAAMMSSLMQHQAALSKIKVPTIIIHGDQDPVFGLDHAEALHKAIANSELIIISGLGHGITNALFYNPIIEGIVKVASTNH